MVSHQDLLDKVEEMSNMARLTGEIELLARLTSEVKHLYMYPEAYEWVKKEMRRIHQENPHLPVPKGYEDVV